MKLTREQAERVIDEFLLGTYMTVDDLVVQAYEAGMRAGIERAAKVSEENTEYWNNADGARERCAAAIRALLTNMRSR